VVKLCPRRACRFAAHAASAHAYDDDSEAVWLRADEEYSLEFGKAMGLWQQQGLFENFRFRTIFLSV
jgi:hypothetical protein